MDYEKAYKESFEAAKGLHDAGNALTKKQMEIVFPQLAESKDERIRKELVAFFIEVRNREGNEGYWHDLKVADILAYIEKQKEQKPVQSDVEKESLQPHWKPTEEQMKALLGAEGISRASGYPDNAKVLASLYEDLKKL